MPIEIKRTFTIPAPVDSVGRALCSESYSVEGATMRDDVESASHTVIREAGDVLEYEVRYVEYARGKTGKIDRSKTQRALTRSVWDGAAKTLRWTYTTEASERFRMAGFYQLTARGEVTQVEYQVTIDVRVPLIGGKIAKMVASGYEDRFPRIQALLTDHATR